MREVIISGRESGQRLDKYLKKYLSKAGQGFIYKMLRKKNIVLNGKKAAGGELLSSGDKIKLFLSEETLAKFMEAEASDADTKSAVSVKKDGLVVNAQGGRCLEYASYKVPVLYEDDNIIFFNKPAGLLSQKSEKNDISLVDIFAEYMKIVDGGISGGYIPGICNRLDRNTSGVVAAGKSVKGLQILSKVIRDRKVSKIYRCIVHGNVREGTRLKGYLVKDEKVNRVTVFNSLKGADVRDAQYIETEYRPVGVCSVGTILEVLLITGKTHQIRAHLASIGHPVVGDVKYGDSDDKRYRRQMLHAYEMKFGEETGILKGVSDRGIVAPYPEDFARYIR